MGNHLFEQQCMMWQKLPNSEVLHKKAMALCRTIAVKYKLMIT